MVNIKSESEIKKMREAGIIAGNALHIGGQSIKPGMTTYELDRIIHDYIVAQGAVPSFLNYEGFPASACISVNDEVIHGIPSKKRKIKNGDIVSIDVGAYYNGYHGDTAYTFAVGNVSEDARRLLEATNASLYKGIEQAVAGNRVGDIGHAVEELITSYGYGIVRKYVGHGVGEQLHEAPEIPNFGKAGHGFRLSEGMVIAIEPMINLVGDDVRVLPNHWTVVTRSGSLAAHFEHTIAITSEGPVLLTKPTIPCEAPPGI
ncbi:MAG: type I methionyl aminopeptidase [Oscillospiraceae bacterium]|nr:type I methionyl aminopeptidase [Oscillospiraceae bacterium]